MTDVRSPACGPGTGVDPELFFPIDERPGSPGVERALAVCRTCSALPECQAWALRERMEAGVWGGLTTIERDALLATDAEALAARHAAEAAARHERARGPRDEAGRCASCRTRQIVRRDGLVVRHDRSAKWGGGACPGSLVVPVGAPDGALV